MPKSCDKCGVGVVGPFRNHNPHCQGRTQAHRGRGHETSQERHKRLFDNELVKQKEAAQQKVMIERMIHATFDGHFECTTGEHFGIPKHFHNDQCYLTVTGTVTILAFALRRYWPVEDETLQSTVDYFTLAEKGFRDIISEIEMVREFVAIMRTRKFHPPGVLDEASRALGDTERQVKIRIYKLLELRKNIFYEGN